MSEKPSYVRRHYFINKKFQLEFSARFLLIIAVTAIAVLVLFFYSSRGTLTAGYTGSEVKLLQTSAYFLPSLLLSTIGIIIFACLTGIVAMILISHRLVGPLFRFQKSLDELNSGDLTLRFNLRDKDQFKELADRINIFAATMDGKIDSIKTRESEIAGLVANLQSVSAAHPALAAEVAPLMGEMAAKLSELQDAAGYFKTSQRK
jgi:methyl-accepting chemotaxis protein